MIAASDAADRAPRGRHGILLTEATDPARQYEWEVDTPTRDFAQQALDRAQDAYKKQWGDTAETDSLLWRVRPK